MALRTGDRTVPLEVQQLERTADYLKELAAVFADDEGDPYGVLENIMLEAYKSTGPGHYMNLNDRLK